MSIVGRGLGRRAALAVVSVAFGLGLPGVVTAPPPSPAPPSGGGAYHYVATPAIRQLAFAAVLAGESEMDAALSIGVRTGAEIGGSADFEAAIATRGRFDKALAVQQQLLLMI